MVELRVPWVMQMGVSSVVVKLVLLTTAKIIVDGFGGDAGCISGGVTECGAVGMDISKMSALLFAI